MSGSVPTNKAEPISKLQPPRKRSFEEMSDPGSKAVNPKKRKTRCFNFEISSSLLPVKGEYITAQLLDITKIEPPRKRHFEEIINQGPSRTLNPKQTKICDSSLENFKIEPSRKRYKAAIRDPCHSKAVNSEQSKTCELSFENLIAPFKAECISATLPGGSAPCNYKIDPSRKSFGQLPLHHAAAEGKLDICQLYVSKSTFIDSIDNKIFTALHWAWKNWQISVANYLLEKGANLNLKAENLEDCRQTPLHFAAAKGKLDMCQLLVSMGAHIDALDDKTSTPLHLAAKEGQVSVVKLLVSKGAYIDAI